MHDAGGAEETARPPAAAAHAQSSGRQTNEIDRLAAAERPDVQRSPASAAASPRQAHFSQHAAKSGRQGSRLRSSEIGLPSAVLRTRSSARKVGDGQIERSRRVRTSSIRSKRRMRASACTPWRASARDQPSRHPAARRCSRRRSRRRSRSRSARHAGGSTSACRMVLRLTSKLRARSISPGRRLARLEGAGLYAARQTLRNRWYFATTCTNLSVPVRS